MAPKSLGGSSWLCAIVTGGIAITLGIVIGPPQYPRAQNPTPIKATAIIIPANILIINSLVKINSEEPLFRYYFAQKWLNFRYDAVEI